MKRIAVLLALGFLCNACDDGDLVFEELDFNNSIPSRCGLNSNLLYKVDDTQAMIVEIASLSTELPLQPTPTGIPKIIAITGTAAGARVIYRLFDGTITGATNICGTIPPATPIVIDEWNATSGNILITTTDIKTANTAEGFEGGEKITSLRHAILFKPIVFQTSTTEIVRDTLSFGNLTESRNVPSPDFGIDHTLEACVNGGITTLYNASGSRSMTLQIDASLLDVELNATDEGLVSTTTNIVALNRFETGLNVTDPDPGSDDDDFCDLASLGIAPVETWTGVAGVADVSGVITITKTETGNTFKYSIHILKLTLALGNSSFLVADDFFFGDYFVPNN